MSITAIMNQVILRPAASDHRTTESGIVLIEAEQRTAVGEVLSVGEEASYRLQPGQLVHYKNGVGYTLDDEGDSVVSVEDIDILGIVGEVHDDDLFQTAEDDDEDDTY